MHVLMKHCKIEQIHRLAYIYNINTTISRESTEKLITEHWEKDGMGECPICFDKIQPNACIITKCSHLFCDKCLLLHLKQSSSCPICRVWCSYSVTMSQIIVYGLNENLIRELTAPNQRNYVNNVLASIIIMSVTTIVIAIVFISITVMKNVVLYVLLHLVYNIIHMIHSLMNYKIDIIWNILST